MLIFILILTFSFAAYVFLGTYILLINPRKGINQLFFINTLLMAAMCIISILIQLSPEETHIQKLYKAGLFFGPSFLASTLIFLLKLSNTIKLKKISLCAIYLPSIIFFIYIVTTPPLFSFIRVDGTWYIDAVRNPFKNIICEIHFGIYILMYFIILIRWYFKGESYKTKRQAFILINTLVLSLSLSLFEKIIFSNIKTRLIVETSPVLLLIFTSGIWYAMIRYRLFRLTPEFVSKELVENIEESIVLIDPNKNILTANEKFRITIGCSVDIQKLKMESFINSGSGIMPLLDSLLEGKEKDFSCRVRFRSPGNEHPLMDCRFSLVRDTFGDILGVMLIAREVKEIKQFHAFYKITDRELNIIDQLVSGAANREIASALGITHNTLKRHIANIYIKLNISNKVELMNLLRDFDIIN